MQLKGPDCGEGEPCQDQYRVARGNSHPQGLKCTRGGLWRPQSLEPAVLEAFLE